MTGQVDGARTTEAAPPTAPALAARDAAAPPIRVPALRDGHPVYVASQYLVRAVIHSLASVTVERADTCPVRGPVIMASNHLSYVDIPFIGAWAPRNTIYFSKSEIRRWPFFGWIAYTYGTVFVRRGEADRQAVRDALAFLANGRMVGVFPEGHRSHGQGLLTAQPGVGLLAQRSRAMVWPVGITGTEHVFKQRRPKIRLRGGEPFDPLAATAAEHGPRFSHQQVADTIMKRIAALLPEPYRGVYG
jgi:1-acyl-sn-glycerol-3-phosphate acyltransferase